MRTLETVLEQNGLASAQQVAEAAARAALHGGDLTTSLLQVTNVDEDALTAALAETYGLPPVFPGALARAHVEAPGLVLADTAERYCCFPLEKAADRLIVAVARPLLPAVKQELAERVGTPVEERIAIEVRIRQAIARDYGLPLAPRHQRGIARLDGAAEQAPEDTTSAVWSVPRLSALPRPPSGPPIATLPTNGHAASPPARSITPAPVNRASRRRGHYTKQLVEVDLQKATTRDEVLGAYFLFVSQYFEYSALFGVHSSLAEGLDAYGPGAEREQVQGIAIPLDLPSSLARAARSAQPNLVVLGEGGLDSSLVQDLERTRERQVLILPVCIKSRCALLLYADNGEQDVRVSELSEVLALTSPMMKALERIILLRKQQKAGKSRRPSQGPGLSTHPPIAPPEPAASEFEPAWPPPIVSAPIAPASRPPGSRPPATHSRPSAARPLQPGRTSPASSIRPAQPSARPKPSKPESRAASSAPIEPAPETPAPPTPVSARPEIAQTAAAQPAVAQTAVAQTAVAQTAVAQPAAEPVRATPATLRPPSEPAVVSRRVVAIEPDEQPRQPTPVPPEDPIFLLRRPDETSEAGAAPRTVPPPANDASLLDGATPSLATPSLTSTTQPFPVPVLTPAAAAAPVAADPVAVAVASSSTAPGSGPLPSTIPPASGPKLPASARVPRHPSARQLAPLRPVEKPQTEITRPGRLYASKRLPSVIIGAQEEPPPEPKRKPSPQPMPAVNGRANHASNDRDLASLVEQLCQGRAEAAVAIAQAGNTALPQLMKRFPGPISNAEGARASECGPLLAALAKIGTPSLGYVVRASESEDEEVRRWAALLLGEMPSADASKAVVQRLADDAPAVAQSAFVAARQLLSGPAANQFRRALFEIADEKRAPLKLRLRSIEHSAKLKDGPSVPRLISLLNTGVEPIIVKSQWALTMITRHDMGRDIQAWSDWWHAHRAQHRIQWLIEALDHDDLRLRRAAFEELGSEVNEDFGYRAELERAERVSAQARYRDWWSAIGARRYGRLY